MNAACIGGSGLPGEGATQKILVVEDSDQVASALRHTLEGSGFQVVTVGNGLEALNAVDREKPDLVVLDLILPGLNGLEVCRRIRLRPETARLPILILSAKAEEATMVIGLELGADDYVVKPIGIGEIVARVRALLRRVSPQPQASILRVGTLEVDLDRYIVTVAGRPIGLAAKEFDLLLALLEAQGRALRRGDLLEKVWGFAKGSEIDTRTLDVHIRRLRRKLEPEGRRIVTVRGVGYRFELLV